MPRVAHPPLPLGQSHLSSTDPNHPFCRFSPQIDHFGKYIFDVRKCLGIHSDIRRCQELLTHCFCLFFAIDAPVRLRFYFGNATAQNGTPRMHSRQPQRRETCLKAYMTRPEKAEVIALARQACVTTSELVRRLVLGQKLPDTARHLAVIELARLNADLSRLGNLFHMALADEDFSSPGTLTLKALLNDIRSTQSAIKAKVLAL